jgi:pimeloyl-ACP methyl ester carboxylesterase
MHLPGIRSRWFEGFVKYSFEAGGRPATVVCPDKPLAGNYWAWKGEFLDAFPQTEIALLRRGFYIVYLNYPNQFGSPAAVAKWNELYGYLTREHGFAAKTALIGLSRGGLYCYQWAAANPGKVACIYGDAPVCDMHSWPGGRGKAQCNKVEWQNVMEAFGFKSEAEALAYDKNPVDNLKALAAARIPILHVYGDADESVPWDENTGLLASRYRKLGGDITLIAKPGVGHHPHGLADPKPVVDFIFKHTVKQ